jgi:hypothetical protein
MAEHYEWMAQRDMAAASPVRKSEPAAGLVFKTTQNVQAHTSAQNGAPSDGEAYPPFADLRAGICQFVVEFCNRKLAERDRKIERLEAQVKMLVALLGKSKTVSASESKAADIVDLPDWRKRHA